MEESDKPPDIKEEKPEIMELDQVKPVRLKIIVGAGKTGQSKGNVDHLQFVEMAQLARKKKTKEAATADVKVSKTRHERKCVSAGAQDGKTRGKDAERMRKRRAAWTEEERAAYRKKEAERKRKVRAAMSDEERAEYRRKDVERQRRRMTRMTPEGIEHFRAVDAECARKRRQKLTEEEKAEMRRKCATYSFMKRAAMTKEEREEERWKKRMEEYARLGRMTREELEQEKRRITERNRKWREGLTGEKLERYKESLARANKKYQQKHPPQKQTPNYMQKRYHKMVQEETPEQRWKRLRVYQIEQAKRLLRRKLDREGLPQEEIKERVQDLVKRMKEEPMPPPETISAYKPRPRKNRKESVEDSEQETSTVRVRTTRSKNNCPPNSSKNSSLFSDVKIIDEPIVTHVSTDYPVDHNENANNDEDEADFSDAFNHYDIQSDPLENDEESDIEETLNSSLTSPPTPVETPQAPDTYNDCDMIDPDPLENNEDDEDDIKEITNSCSTPQSPLETPATPQLCPHCPATFNDQNLLKDHLRSFHLNKCFKCPKCKEIVLSPKELSDHFKTHLMQPLSKKEETSLTSAKNFPFTCIKCPTSVGFQSQEKLSEHVQLSHPGSFFPCQHCKVIMYSKRSLTTHLKSCKIATEQAWVVPQGASRNCKLKKCTDW